MYYLWYLFGGHDPIEGPPVLHQIGERREEPAVADLTLVDVEPVGRPDEHLRPATQTLPLAYFLNQKLNFVISVEFHISLSKIGFGITNDNLIIYHLHKGSVGQSVT